MMKKRLFIIIRFYSMCICSVALLSSCNDADLQSSDSLIPIPGIIQKTQLPATGSLAGYVRVDDEPRQEMTITQDAASVTIGNLEKGMHKFTIEFEFTNQANSYSLAVAFREYDVNSSNNALNFSESDYTFPDADNDGIINLVELEKGSNPDDNFDRPFSSVRIPYIAEGSNYYSVWNLDPGDIENPSLVSDSVLKGTYVKSAHFDPELKHLFDIHNRDVVWFNENGEIYKNSLIVSETPPAPVRLSNESGSAVICTLLQASDFSDYNNTRIVYSIPSSGTSCATPIWKMVTMGISESDTPLPAKPVKISLLEPDTGAHAGWLGVENNNLMHFTSDFDAFTILDSNNVSDVKLLGSLPNGKLILEVMRGVTSPYRLHLYDISTKVLSNSFFSFASSTFEYVADHNYLFFANQDPGSTTVRLYRFDINTPGFPDEILSSLSNQLALFLYQTANTVVYSYGDNIGGTISQFAKTSPPGVSPNSVYQWSDGVTVHVDSSATRVYFNAFVDNYFTGHAIAIDEDGQVSDDISHRWISSTEARTAPGVVAQTLDTFVSPLLKEHIFISGFNAENSGLEFSDQELKSYQMETGDLTAVLGTLPGNVEYFNISPTSIGPRVVTNSRFRVGVENNYDLMYLDASVAGSLQRVTETSGLDEYAR